MPYLSFAALRAFLEMHYTTAFCKLQHLFDIFFLSFLSSKSSFSS